MVKKIVTFFDEIGSTDKELAYALLMARITTAVFFITHGYDKFFCEMGLAGFAGMLTKFGFPMVDVFAFLVALLSCLEVSLFC